jgi:hypothetical protein
VLTGPSSRIRNLSDRRRDLARGRGRALSIALIQLPNYRDTNPTLAASASRVIREALADHNASDRVEMPIAARDRGTASWP